MGRYAVIDIGSNSVKFHAARVIHGRVTPLDDRLLVTRLGEGLAATGELDETAIGRTVAAVVEFRRRAEALGVEKVVAVGTEALRRAENADELLALVERRARLRVEILDPEREATYAYRAARAALADLPDAVTVFDCGGASTEVIVGRGERIVAWGSVPVGVRTLTDAHRLEGRVPDQRQAAAEAAVREGLAGLPRPAGEALVGIGGAPHTLVTAIRGERPEDPASLDGTVVTRDEIAALRDRLRQTSLTERRRWAGLMPERADVALAGALVVLHLMETAEQTSFVVCSAGIRHGVFRERFVR